MGKINHNDAHYIEILVRNLYKLDLGKPPLIANADTFETSPIYALCCYYDSFLYLCKRLTNRRSAIERLDRKIRIEF